jgi:hypothetical protein
MKTIRRLLRRPTRLDRPIDAPVFDLEVVHRAFEESLLVARLFRRPARYVKQGRNDVQAREG